MDAVSPWILRDTHVPNQQFVREGPNVRYWLKADINAYLDLCPLSWVKRKSNTAARIEMELGIRLEPEESTLGGCLPPQPS